MTQTLDMSSSGEHQHQRCPVQEVIQHHGRLLQWEKLKKTSCSWQWSYPTLCSRGIQGTEQREAKKSNREEKEKFEKIFSNFEKRKRKGFHFSRFERRKRNFLNDSPLSRRERERDFIFSRFERRTRQAEYILGWTLKQKNLLFWICLSKFWTRREKYSQIKLSLMFNHRIDFESILVSHKSHVKYKVSLKMVLWVLLDTS